jgi:hypothetical protein
LNCIFSYIADRQRRYTLPNIKRKHKHRRSIAPYVKEDERHFILGALAILIMFSSLIKRLIKLPFIYPVKVSIIYSNIQLSFVDDIPITCNTKALESYEIITDERARVCVCVCCEGGIVLSQLINCSAISRLEMRWWWLLCTRPTCLVGFLLC